MASGSSATDTTIKDATWMRQSFMLPVRAISEEDASRRVYSTAKWKWQDTSLGGNIALNPLPQFTRWADLPTKNYFNVGNGMGRYYSEVFDDNQQRIHLRFGVPEYNSLGNFFTSFYDPAISALTRKGRGKGIFYSAGYLIGSVLALPLAVFNSVSGIMRYWMGQPAYKFAYLKPSMPLYWNALQDMLNTVAANMGMGISAQNDRYANWGNAGNTVMDVKAVPDEQMEIVRRMMPQSWGDSGGLNIYAVSRRAQMYADAYYRRMREALDAARNTEELQATLQAVESGDLHWDLTDYSKDARSMQQYIADYVSTQMGMEGAETAGTETATQNTDGTPTTGNTASGAKTGEAQQPSEVPEQAGSWWGGQSQKGTDPTQTEGMTKVWNHLVAEAREGSAWLSLRVDHIGSIGESISTSVSESGLAGAINSVSSSKRKLQFNLAGGNIGDNVVAQIAESAISSVTSLLSGAADSIGIGGLGVLLGAGLADLPKDWESTSVNLPKADFTIQLRTPYGNKISRFQNLIVPLCALLTGALPRSLGPSSYERPFMCELFYQGRQQVRYGVIDSLSITRGVGNVGWTQNGEPLGIDVSFSVLDLSSIMHMPIAKGIMDNGSPLRYFFGDDTTYSDYLSTLAGVSLSDRTYGFEVLKRRWKNARLDFDSYFSTAHFATAAFNNLPGRLIQAIAHQSNRN
jgi:hypothetical protein